MALRNLAFVDVAYSSVANMYEAMKALEQGAPVVQNLAAKWSINLTVAEAQELVDEFKLVQKQPICELRESKIS
jgi:hypothetical protein